jgi:hypothetical protein
MELEKSTTALLTPHSTSTLPSTTAAAVHSPFTATASAQTPASNQSHPSRPELATNLLAFRHFHGATVA